MIKIFTEHNINFIHQYSFPDLLSDKGNKLRFDFGILRNDKLVGLIEYNGEQHYSCAPRGYFTEENLERIRQHDALKIKYCNDDAHLAPEGFYQCAEAETNIIMYYAK